MRLLVLLTVLVSIERVTSLAAVVGGYAVTRRLAKLSNKDSLFAFSVKLGAPPAADAMRHDVLAAQVWPASRAVAFEMQTIVREAEAAFCDQSRPLQVLELGSGSGLAGLAAAKFGAEVLCTDVDKLSPLLIGAAASEQGLAVKTAHLDLLDSEPAPLPSADLLVLADVFVTTDVAEGAARRCWEALSRGSWVIAASQGDRSCRGAFLEHLRRTIRSEEARSTTIIPPQQSEAIRRALEQGWTDVCMTSPTIVDDDGGGRRLQPLILWDVDELSVKY